MSYPIARVPVPEPGYVHPFYEDQKAWILDWLNGRSPYANRQYVVRPIEHHEEVSFSESPHFGITIKPLIITLQKCAGPAPYVGRPFAYKWYVGVDDYGRCVAGDAVIQYLDIGGIPWEWTEDSDEYLRGIGIEEL